MFAGVECVAVAEISSSPLGCSCHADPLWGIQQNVLSCFNSILHEHRHSHGSNPSGYWGDEACFLPHTCEWTENASCYRHLRHSVCHHTNTPPLSGLTFKIHISNQPVLSCDWVLHSVYSNVDHCCSFFDHVSGNEVGNP